MTEPIVITGYANPDGNGEGNWSSEDQKPTEAADEPYYDPLWDRYVDGDR